MTIWWPLAQIGRALTVIESKLAVAGWPVHAMRTGRKIFVSRQLAIMVFIQAHQFGSGVGDFVRIDDAIAIHIEGLDDGRRRRVPGIFWSIGGPGRHIFIWSQFAVMVFVQSQQFGAGVGDLIGIDDAVVIAAQREDERKRRRTMPALLMVSILAARTAGAAHTWAIHRGTVVLGDGGQGGNAEREEREGYFVGCFHTVSFFVIEGVKFLRGPCRP